jgi:hypothetical protein
VIPEPGGEGRSVNPIPTIGGRFCPPFTTGTHKFFHLPASLNQKRSFYEGYFSNKVHTFTGFFFLPELKEKSYSNSL